MNDLAELGVSEARRAGASYADFRFEELAEEEILLKNGEVEAIERSSSAGFGIRVLVNGSWGFAACPETDRDSVLRTARRAVALAKEASRTQRRAVVLDDSPPPTGSYATPVLRDPFQTPISEKIALLQEAHRNMAKVPGVFLTEGVLRSWRRRQLLKIDGAAPVEQRIVQTGGGISAYATDGKELQRRSYPQSHGGDYATAGWEFVLDMRLPEHAGPIAEEAVALLRAPPVPEGRFPLVIGSAQMALQIHESVGHPTELDRIFGTEISFAGGSWIRPEDVGSVRYGSPEMNVVCDATLPRGLGTFGFDDEGVAARKYDLVRGGILTDALSSRETAARIGRRSGGAMRSDGWNRLPLVRMTNVSLEPGNRSFEQLLDGISHGLYVECNKSWSIDDRRLNFQFATEYAREIRNGKLGGLLKNPVYHGIGPEFWSNLEARGDGSTWRLWGVPSCGKGQPMQVARVGHGAPAARFRSVDVRPAK